MMNDQQIGIYDFSEEVRKALSGLEYEQLTDVQQQVIPLVLEGKDSIVKAETGSGKTAAFAIPVCERIEIDRRNPQALVLTPTRELAVQVKQDISNIGRFKKIRCAAVFGRQSMEGQKRELAQRVHVIVGTPGRTLDHIERKNIKLEDIKYLIIDEADKLLDMGFIDQVEAIIEMLPVKRTTLLFSATMPERISEICSTYMRDPVRVEIASLQPVAQQIEQSYYEVDEHEKTELLHKLIYKVRPDSAILFCNTRERADVVAASLRKAGFVCESLHGGLEQRERLQTMERFKRGEVHFLVATDVAARGIHVDDVGLVVNVDIPLDKETYVHRIGRTGRAGSQGLAVTFALPRELSFLAALEEYVDCKISRWNFPSAEEVAAGRASFAAGRMEKSELKPLKSEQLNKEITRIRINGGKRTKMRPGDILGAITSMAGITAADIGIIDIQDTCSYVEIHGEKGRMVLEALPATKIKGKIYSSRLVPCRSL